MPERELLPIASASNCVTHMRSATTLLWPKWAVKRSGRQDVLGKLCKRLARSVPDLRKWAPF